MNKRQKDKKIKMRNKKLIKNYPFLTPRNVFSDKLHSDYNYEYTWYDDINKGWQIGFGKFLLEDLKQALIETNYLYDFRFLQIKEKWGRLNLYANGVPEKVQDVLDKYEFISQYVCIKCGSPHACVLNDHGWYLPLCRDCWDKTNKWRGKGGYKATPYEEAAGGEVYEMPDSYTRIRYFKGEEQEIVYDISETKDKIIKAYRKRERT